MAADLHYQLGGRAGQELIGAKGSPAGTCGDPRIFGFGGYDILVAFLARDLDRGIDAGQLTDLLDMPVQFPV